MTRTALVVLWLALFSAFSGHTAVLTGHFVPRDSGNVNLTSAGAIEWIHYGLDPTTNNRTAGINTSAQRLADFVVIGTNALQQVTNTVEFSWANGTPVLSATNVNTSMAVLGLTN